MPRSARIDTPGLLHHVMIRGIERRKIFRNRCDHDDFIERLAKLIPETQTACYAWVLMSNHAHFLFRSGPAGIAGLMRRLLTGYVLGFNRRYKRHGQLLQNRYKSIICQEDTYLKELVRYIHLNPLRTSMVPDLRALKRYSACGHATLLGKNGCEWQDTTYVLRYFGKSRADARKSYRDYMRAGLNQGRRPELVGGGLIRSAGGWAAVKKMGSRGMARIKGDQRILGGSEFVQQILDQADEKLERAYELQSRNIDLKAIAVKAAGIFGIDPTEIFIKSRLKPRADARALYCFWAVRELGVSLSDLAVELKITASGVGYAVNKGEALARTGGYDLME